MNKLRSYWENRAYRYSMVIGVMLVTLAFAVRFWIGMPDRALVRDTYFLIHALGFVPITLLALLPALDPLMRTRGTVAAAFVFCLYVSLHNELVVDLGTNGFIQPDHIIGDAAGILLGGLIWHQFVRGERWGRTSQLLLAIAGGAVTVMERLSLTLMASQQHAWLAARTRPQLR